MLFRSTWPCSGPRAGWDARERGQRAEQAWRDVMQQYTERFPEQAAEFERRTRHALPDDFTERARAIVEKMQHDDSKVATRKASGMTLEAFGTLLPELLGGSADLTGSNNTKTKATASITPDDFTGRYVHWGVREHGMAAGMNGMALHGGLIGRASCRERVLRLV